MNNIDPELVCVYVIWKNREIKRLEIPLDDSYLHGLRKSRRFRYLDEKNKERFLETGIEEGVIFNKGLYFYKENDNPDKAYLMLLNRNNCKTLIYKQGGKL